MVFVVVVGAGLRLGLVFAGVAAWFVAGAAAGHVAGVAICYAVLRALFALARRRLSGFVVRSAHVILVGATGGVAGAGAAGAAGVAGIVGDTVGLTGTAVGTLGSVAIVFGA